MSFFSSLRARMLLLLAFAALPGFGLILYTYEKQRSAAVSEVQRDAWKFARLEAKNLEGLVVNVQQLLAALGELHEIRSGDGASCNALLTGVLKHYPYYLNIGVTDGKGMIFCSALPIVRPVPASDRTWFKRAVATRHFVSGDFQVGRITRKPSINFAFPVLDRTKHISRVIFAAVSLEWIQQLTSDVPLKDGEILLVVDRRGFVLSRRPPPENAVGKSFKSVPFIGTILSQKEGSVEILDVDGLRRLYAFAPVHPVETGLYTAFGISNDAAFTKINRTFSRSVVFLIIFTACILASSSFFSRLLVLKPMNMLVHAAWRFGRGDLSIRTGIPHDNDEFGRLARAFDEMGESLSIILMEHKETQKALEESNRQLKRTLEELKEAQDYVVRKERLHALGQMASGIAHDFNNHLMPVLGFSEILMDNPQSFSDKERVMNYLKMINTSARDAANVVSRLREFYRMKEEGEKFLPVEPNSIVQQVISLTQPRWKDQAMASGKCISIETEFGDVSMISANEAELREMLINLIFNAVDALTHGGKIKIGTRMCGGRVVFEISDTGKGMTEEVLKRCMEPFFSTKGEKGTGLGLSMVFGAVNRHEGSIETESEPDKGTTFRLYFPVVKEESLISSGKEERKNKPRRLRVLVVDDEPKVRDVICRYLERDGHCAFTASNGREGVEKFLTDDFDLVITDRAMPEMTGDAMAAAIKKIMPRVPVIMLSGFADLMSATGEKPPGVDFVVGKPVTLSALRDVLARV